MYLEPNWPLFRGVTNFHGDPSTSLFIEDSSSMVLVLQEGLLHRSYTYGPVEGYMDVSKNSGTPKSSILIGFSIINHPFWGSIIFGNIHMEPCKTSGYSVQTNQFVVANCGAKICENPHSLWSESITKCLKRFLKKKHISHRHLQFANCMPTVSWLKEKTSPTNMLGAQPHLVVILCLSRSTSQLFLHETKIVEGIH